MLNCSLDLWLVTFRSEFPGVLVEPSTSFRGIEADVQVDELGRDLDQVTGSAAASGLFGPGLTGKVVGEDVLDAQVRMEGTRRLARDHLPAGLAGGHTPRLGQHDLEVLDPGLLLR